jgi:hypothetical protein
MAAVRSDDPVLAWGGRLVLALAVAEAVTQFVNFGVLDLRYGLLDAGRQGSVFGALTVVALAAAGAAVVLHLAAARSREPLGLAALALVLVCLLGLRITHVHHAVWYGAPLAIVVLAVLWNAGRDGSPERSAFRLGTLLLLVAFVAHGPGELVAQHYDLGYATWLYQAKVVVKHAFELAGWGLLAAGLLALYLRREPLFARAR